MDTDGKIVGRNLFRRAFGHLRGSRITSGATGLAALLACLPIAGCNRKQNINPPPTVSAARISNGHLISNNMSDAEILHAFDLDIRSATRRSIQGKDGTSVVYEAADQQVTVTRSLVSGTSVLASGPLTGAWQLTRP